MADKSCMPIMILVLFNYVQCGYRCFLPLVGFLDEFLFTCYVTCVFQFGTYSRNFTSAVSWAQSIRVLFSFASAKLLVLETSGYIVVRNGGECKQLLFAAKCPARKVRIGHLELITDRRICGSGHQKDFSIPILNMNTHTT